MWCVQIYCDSELCCLERKRKHSNIHCIFELDPIKATVFGQILIFSHLSEFMEVCFGRYHQDVWFSVFSHCIILWSSPFYSHKAACIVCSEHREQTEGRPSWRPWFVSDGRRRALPSGQSHSPALCRQHPRPLTCSGTSHWQLQPLTLRIITGWAFSFPLSPLKCKKYKVVFLSVAQ